MPAWVSASAVYFVYVAAVALWLPALSRTARMRAAAGALLGVALSAAGIHAEAFWLRFFVLPSVALLVGYWCSGLLWVAPMERIEKFLASSDRALSVPAVAARVPRALSELLEIAYAGVYPLIPLALVLHLWYTRSPDGDRFWTVILLTDYVCFAMLPWIQTRPPRELEREVPWTSSFRAFNLKLLGSTSTGVNTVPSGHAAEGLAAALLVTGAPLQVVAPMWIAALAVAAGAVFGRYHYAVDALAGWFVAVIVWSVCG